MFFWFFNFEWMSREKINATICFTLNCFVCKMSCMILKKFLLIWIGFRLDFLSFINRFISDVISLTNDVNIQHNPEKKHIGSAPIIDKLNETRASMSNTIKYPTGFFQLNGILLMMKINRIKGGKSYEKY